MAKATKAALEAMQEFAVEQFKAATEFLSERKASAKD